MTPEVAETLDFRDAERTWNPFSAELLWRGCPGHEWQRGLWDKEERVFYPMETQLGLRLAAIRIPGQHRFELITRCACCGAARCDSYLRFRNLTDHEQQLYRCTIERHHPVEVGLDHMGHDYLVS